MVRREVGQAGAPEVLDAAKAVGAHELLQGTRSSVKCIELCTALAWTGEKGPVLKVSQRSWTVSFKGHKYPHQGLDTALHHHSSRLVHEMGSTEQEGAV